MNNQSELESIVRERLEEIKSVPPRDPQVAARARAQFLSQAVSASEFQRHKGWKSIFRKEQFAMNALLSILVIAGVLLGGGATVSAAQDDLPNQPLYAVKMVSEDISLQFQNNPQEKADRLMELAQIRLQEMQRLVETGQPLPDQVRQRLEQHIDQALQIYSQMNDPALNRTLLQVRDRLQDQDRDMQQLQIHAAAEAQPILQHTQTMLQQRLQLVEDGLLNHEMFRNAARNGFRYVQTQTAPPVMTSTPVAPSEPQNNQFQNGRSTPQVVPTNGSGVGPNVDPGGPNPQATPIPKYDGTGPNGNHSGSDGSGHNGSGGMDSGGNGPGGDDTGGNGPGGNRP